MISSLKILQKFSRLKKVLDANAETEPELAEQYQALSNRCSKLVGVE